MKAVTVAGFLMKLVVPDVYKDHRMKLCALSFGFHFSEFVPDRNMPLQVIMFGSR
jgi:hypothetical protein